MLPAAPPASAAAALCAGVANTTLAGGGTTSNDRVTVSESIRIPCEPGSGDPLLTDPAEDVRGWDVRDAAGALVGVVEALLLDYRERRVRLLGVAMAGAVGARLVPVDAISRITGRQVTLNRSLAHVLASPGAGGSPPSQQFLESVYAHYGLYPWWAPGYVYPSYPAY
jgi:hypothetical protein